ncbi:hypothetical protein M8J76_004695 [Diaphorina citri]|nr:hypothetical protein M8J75_012586 [Diaphorina citri]KAI5744726.1 hypothetical protein M8J76_004695 [Diaphorina citri]
MELRFVLYFAIGSAILLVQVPSAQSVIVKLAYDLIRNNLIGTPEFFREQKWHFDPDVGARRMPEFTKVHGYHSAITIEKLGLGTDGYQELRREEQRIRDLGVPTQLPHTLPREPEPSLGVTPSYPAFGAYRR